MSSFRMELVLAPPSKHTAVLDDVRTLFPIKEILVIGSFWRDLCVSTFSPGYSTISPPYN